MHGQFGAANSFQVITEAAKIRMYPYNRVHPWLKI